MNRGIIQWSPMRDLNRFFEEDMWEGVNFTPAVDVYQDRDNVIVETPLAGVDPEKVEISVENDVLTISGATEGKKEVKREDYYRKEVRSGSFSRSVILPMSVKADMAEAHSEQGMLKIIIPKADEVKPKRIAVKVK
ncbi:MAG: Hsp20/alpha crystallin family protein [Candidatus Moraniibacteriota bacterium]